MNGMDIFVIAVIAVFVLVGISRGFLLNVIRMAGSLVSAVVSMVCYPAVCTLARGTFLYTNIKDGIINSLGLHEAAEQATKSAQAMLIESLPLPQFFRDKLIINNNSVIYELLGVDNIVDYIGGFLANIVLNVLVSILLYITCYTVISCILGAFKILKKAPVIRTIGRVGGGLTGFVTATVFIWALFAALDAFAAQPFYTTLLDEINASTVAVLFYDTDIIRTFMMSRMF
ncbi:MAG: CvpA family protein [Firmicutes bacterium]|nr:CvpA family protein [Bacillota bacterium]